MKKFTRKSKKKSKLKSTAFSGLLRWSVFGIAGFFAGVVIGIL